MSADPDLAVSDALSSREAGAGGAEGNPRVIASEIERTRSEMSGTIDEIQRRIDPEQLGDQAVEAATEITVQARDAAKDVAKYAIEEAKTAVRELADQATSAVRASTVGKVEDMAMKTRDAAEGAGTDLFTLIRQNPLPAALAAVGIGWLWMQRQSQPTGQANRLSYGSPYASYEGRYAGMAGYSGYGGAGGGPSMIDQATGKAERIAGSAQQAAGALVGDAQQMTGQAVDQVQQIAGQAADQVQGTAMQMQHKAASAVEGISADPLAVGTLGVVLGAVTGFLVPESEQERQLMGPAREKLIDRVESVGGETVDKVQQVAMAAREAAMQEAANQGLGQAGESSAS